MRQNPQRTIIGAASRTGTLIPVVSLRRVARNEYDVRAAPRARLTPERRQQLPTELRANRGRESTESDARGRKDSRYPFNG